MEHQLSLHLKKFNDRIKVMNQTNSKDLNLSAADARQLQADIFDLLIQIQTLAEVKKEKDNEVITVEVSGGKFSHARKTYGKNL
jgi:hypothetical protein